MFSDPPRPEPAIECSAQGLEADRLVNRNGYIAMALRWPVNHIASLTAIPTPESPNSPSLLRWMQEKFLNKFANIMVFFL